MSKSLGNFFTIRDVLQQYHPLAIRWFLINSHYRQPINYTERILEEVNLFSPSAESCAGLIFCADSLHSVVPQASDRLYYVYQTLLDAEAAVAAAGTLCKEAASSSEEETSCSDFLAAVEAALSDDLNTPKANALLSEPLKSLNDLLHTKKVRN